MTALQLQKEHINSTSMSPYIKCALLTSEKAYKLLMQIQTLVHVHSWNHFLFYCQASTWPDIVSVTQFWNIFLNKNYIKTVFNVQPGKYSKSNGWKRIMKWINKTEKILSWPLQDAAWHLGKIQGPFQLPGPFHWTVKETFPASPPIHSSPELAHTLWAVPCLHLLLLLLLAQVHLCILAKTSGVSH